MSKKEIALKTPVLSMEKNLQAMYQSTICDSFTMSKKDPKIHPVWKKKSLMNVVAQIHFNFIVQKSIASLMQIVYT